MYSLTMVHLWPASLRGLHYHQPLKHNQLLPVTSLAPRLSPAFQVFLHAAARSVRRR